MFISDTRQATQFCTFRPGMRRNSRSLLVTIVRSAALACAAIHKSLLPTGCPWASSAARNIPYVFPAFSGIGRTGTKVLNSASNCRTFLRCLLFSAPHSSSPHVITDIAASPGSSFWKRSNTFPGLWRWMKMQILVSSRKRAFITIPRDAEAAYPDVLQQENHREVRSTLQMLVPAPCLVPAARFRRRGGESQVLCF